MLSFEGRVGVSEMRKKRKDISSGGNRTRDRVAYSAQGTTYAMLDEASIFRHRQVSLNKKNVLCVLT